MCGRPYSARLPASVAASRMETLLTLLVRGCSERSPLRLMMARGRPLP